MAKELIINASLPEVRIALMEDGQIQELLIERQSEKGIVGNIYKGRVTRVLPGMQAAFVDVGLDKAAFLYVDDIYVHPRVMGDETEIAETEESGTSEGVAEGLPEGMTDEPADVTAEEIAEVTAQLEASSVEAELESEAETESDSENEIESSELDSDEASDETSDNEAVSTEAARSEESAEEFTEESDTESETENETGDESAPLEGLAQSTQKNDRKTRGRTRNRRRGRGRTGTANAASKDPKAQFAAGESFEDPENAPDNLIETLQDRGEVQSDRSQMEGESKGFVSPARPTKVRPEFREPRGRDRRIKSRHSKPRLQANISDLLREGQEVIVQVAKDPIATKGARLTCHVSLPGRHLVCMPTIDHVGVSRRIERDDERRRLRDFVEKNRPYNMGFIVRTASGGKDPESWIKQDIDYLSKLWSKIRNRSDEVSAPGLVYEDLNSVLRAIRDWVNEDIDKIIVDSRYHYNDLIEFSERFMPALIEKIELYQGDIPIFDAYGISAELHRSLERKVWLKSGGYIVIDQAEALVAIDVNTGRFVGKKNLEDTILKTNLEAAEEIAYQLRLRNCGGIIIVDLIDMERDENRMRVYRALDEALKKDRARPTIQKISDLGLVEMTRKRTRDTIIRTLCEPCVHCEGKGFTKSTRTVAYEILREVERLGVDREARKVLISAHESVIDILAIDLRDAIDSLEKRYNKTVFLQTILDQHTEQFEVVTDRTPGKKQSTDIARQLRIERDRAERKEKQKQRQKEDSAEMASEESEGFSERNPDRNPDRNSDRISEDHEMSAPAVASAPAKKAEGSFVIKAQVIVPRSTEARLEGRTAETRSDSASDQTNDPSDADMGETDSVQGETHREIAGSEVMIPKTNPSRRPGGNTDGGYDEDQLAYLRAQAAQDAALAYGAAPANGNERPQRNQPRTHHPRNNNQRNRNSRDTRGGGRGRPQQQRFPNKTSRFGSGAAGGSSSVGVSASNSIAAQQPAFSNQGPTNEVQVPDYEVLVKPGTDGSNS